MQEVFSKNFQDSAVDYFYNVTLPLSVMGVNVFLSLLTSQWCPDPNFFPRQEPVWCWVSPLPL